MKSIIYSILIFSFIFFSFDIRSSCVSTQISQLPFKITMSGSYCLTKNLRYDKNDAAIIVNANNVNIDLNNHSIIIRNPATIGIKVINSNDVSINNGLIVCRPISTNINNNGIFVQNSKSLTFNNLFVQRFFNGLNLLNSNLISILNCNIQNANKFRHFN